MQDNILHNHTWQNIVALKWTPQIILTFMPNQLRQMILLRRFLLFTLKLAN
jgi:hypothetical protein